MSTNTTPSTTEPTTAPVETTPEDLLTEQLRGIEMGVLTEGVTLSQLIREGAGVTEKEEGWGAGFNACTLSAAAIAARARGFAQ